MSRTVRAGSRSIEISHPDKTYFPDDGLTKGDLVDYYHRIADTMLPYLEDRPLTMHRFPDGIDGDGFIQQQRPDYFPDWVGRVTVERREGGSIDHAVVTSTADLLTVANSGCITPHLWLSRTDRLERPDQLIFDLDPPPDGGFDEVRFAAQALRDLMDELGLVPLVKTTGSKGLHVVVPLTRRHGFDEVRDFCRDVAELLVQRHPDRLTTEQRTAKRKRRLYVDVQRNAYGQHAVAPYAVRALPGAPVATPLEWDEVGRSSLGPRRYTVGNLFRRLGQRSDPWKGAWRNARSLGRPRQRLEKLSS